MSISFGGQQINRPGAYSVVDSNSMVPKSVGGFRALAVIGPVGTGATITDFTRVYAFNSPSEASKSVGTGDTLDVMYSAWQHGADLIILAPAQITNPATAPTDSEWQTAIDLLEAEFVDGVIPATTQQAIWTKVDTHVTSMSTVKNRRERRAFYGHAKNLALSAIKTLSTTVNSERALIASPAVYVYDSTGNKVLKDATLLAGAYAGLWASKAPQDPITYDYVKFAGLEKIYKGTEIDELLEAKIAVTEFVRGKGFRIVQGVTTSASADLTKSELSVSTVKDVISVALRNFFEERYVGQAAIAGITTSIYNDLVSLVEGFLKAGLISGYEPETLRVIQNGTAFTVEWQGKPTLPINNFLITSSFTL